MNLPKVKKELGQTLVGILIALAIFGLILTPFVSTLANLSAAQVRYRQRIQASQLAREDLEIVYNFAVNSDDWEQFVDTHANDQVWHPLTSPLSLEEGEATIGRMTHGVSFIKNGNILEVTANVSWNERGQLHQIELMTALINLSS